MRQRRVLELESELERESESPESRSSLELPALRELPERDELALSPDDDALRDDPLELEPDMPPSRLLEELDDALRDDPLCELELDAFWLLPDEPDDALRLELPSPCDELPRSRFELLDEPLMPLWFLLSGLEFC